jgi:hypothetical protein
MPILAQKVPGERLKDSRQDYELIPLLDPMSGSICCPVCGNDYTHVEGVIRDGRGNYGGAAILFSCECSEHRFQLVVDDHKGNCHLRVEATERRSGFDRRGEVSR